MVTMLDCLQPNGEELAAKVIDGEAILINLSTGVYYSMDNVGGFIWELIEQGCALETIVSALTTKYEVSRDQAQVDVEHLAAQLLAENLVTASNDGSSPQEFSERNGDQLLPYEKPTLNIYRDMGDLLALDPPVPGLQEIVWKDPG